MILTQPPNIVYSHAQGPTEGSARNFTSYTCLLYHRLLEIAIDLRKKVKKIYFPFFKLNGVDKGDYGML